MQNQALLLAKSKMQKKFSNTGVILGLLSGLTFGIYGVIAGMAMTELDPVNASIQYGNIILGALMVAIVCSAMNDAFAAIWLLGYNIIKGKQKELNRTLKTKPGIMIVIGALAGGPIANAAYLIAIAYAGGAYAIPISALCPMVGAILARILFKQAISARVALGIVLSIVGVIVISYTPPEGETANFYLGVAFAVVAAVGWGVEGAISSFGGSVLDPAIAINIRQIVSGVVFFLVMIPIVGSFDFSLSYVLTGVAFGMPYVVILMVIAAFAAAVSFLTWYQANSMVGCATGMALNITYVFWGVVFAVVLQGAELTVIAAIGGIILMLGALIVSINPLDLIKSKKVAEVEGA